jgi:hypothetical protein
MVRRSKPAQERLPLTFTSLELADLDRLRSPGPERSALADFSGVELDGEVTDSVLLHAVFAAGLRVVREMTEARAYAEAALEKGAKEHANRKASRRKRPSPADK